MKTKPPLFNEYISWCQQPFQTWSTTALSTHRETPALTLWAPLWLGHVMNAHPYPACSGITGGWLACRHVLEKSQNSCRSAIGTVHKRTLGRINFHTGLIIPFLIGPLSGVFPFPHTSMMESKKNVEGDAWILAMVKISYRFLALTEIDLKHCYKMTGPTSFCSKCCLLQNDTPSRKHTSYKMVWFRGKFLLQNDSVC